MAQQLLFNKTNLNAIEPSKFGKRLYFTDQKFSNLGLSVTPAGIKSFFVVKRFDGNTRRVTLGRFPDLTPDTARKKAIEALNSIAKGVNPIEEKRKSNLENVTLRQVFDDYISDRKSLKAGTVLDYQNAMNQTFSDWLDKPIKSITRDKVRQRHTERGQKSPARANGSFRVLRALCNFAMHRYEDANGISVIERNPVKILSDTKAWYRVDRRQTYIEANDLPKWFEAVSALPENVVSDNASTVSDYLLFLLFTGVRREEAACLKWDDINFNINYFTLDDTKNRETVKLPLCSFLQDLLGRRYKTRINEFVFPGEGVTGHLINAHRQIQHITATTGIAFSAHDLRRTFATIGEGLEIGHVTLKRLLNHKSGESDVTTGYVIANNDRLMNASQKICDFILELMKIACNEQEMSFVTTKVN